jgi:hypothetical protein
MLAPSAVSILGMDVFYVKVLISSFSPCTDSSFSRCGVVFKVGE